MTKICSIFQQLLHCKAKPYETTSVAAPPYFCFFLRPFQLNQEQGREREGGHVVLRDLKWAVNPTKVAFFIFQRKKKEKSPYIFTPLLRTWSQNIVGRSKIFLLCTATCRAKIG
jgi:hypothetical protein